MGHSFARTSTSPQTTSLDWTLTSCSALACRIILEKNCGDANFHHCSISSVSCSGSVWESSPLRAFPILAVVLWHTNLKVVGHQCFTGSEAIPAHYSWERRATANTEKRAQEMEQHSPTFQVGSKSWSHQEEGAGNWCQSYCFTITLGRGGKRKGV